MKIVPVTFRWQQVDVVDADGVAVRAKAMVPHPRFHNIVARQFADGEEYTLVPLEARSRASHNHYFAAIKDGFDNLPENLAARWETTEHLRKWCLIQTGWFVEKEVDFGSALYAKRAALLLHDEFDEFVRIFQPDNGTKLIIRKAKSQAIAAMGKADFEASKKDVLDIIESMIRVEPGTLAKHAGQSA